MSKRGTVYIFGAGASYISTAPEAQLPLQKGFFACIFASDFVPQKMALEEFMQQPFRQWLIERGYGEPYDLDSRLTNDFNINLEEFYSEIENDIEIDNDQKYTILKSLDRIIFESIAIPITGIRNNPDKSCPNYRSLVKLTRPGDTVINLNYDCLADDALFHFCPYWHPVTGHGFKFDDIFGGALPKKAKIFQSSVLLLKPHGSVTFRYKIKNDHETLIRLVGLTGGIQPLGMPMADGWEPFIVAPSTSKSGHHTYMENILSIAKRKIKRAKNVIIIGYSFPPNDIHVRNTLKGFEGDLTIVNPSWDSTDYKARLNDMGFTDYTGFRGFEEFLQSKANLI
jgi:hypothetical protein